MSGLSIFGWTIGANDSTELPDIFPLSIEERVFVDTDVEALYQKVLTDVIERVQGLPEELEPLLWDNCVKSGTGKGLISLIAEAMACKSELFLVYDKAVEVIRKANQQEQEQIKADYESTAKSSTGIYISFKKYFKTDLIRLYSALEYCAVGSLYKGLQVSKALQFKINELRGSTSVMSSADVKAQAKAMAEHLSRGKNIMLDAKDEVTTTSPDMTAAKETVAFLNSKRAYHLGMPSSYINGEQNSSGLSDTGKADSKATERGLRKIFFSIVKPVLEAILDQKVSFKSLDVDSISTALETIKTFELIGEDLLTKDEQRMILAMQLNIPEENKDLVATEDSNNGQGTPTQSGTAPQDSKSGTKKP